ncbi:unnamed protein product [Oikopleura dioica]|uniref:Uncharacterized protein n=1 Tax=Oikopleura dioica TaxID=34765 RepID=E4XRM9_OIKDI|nr:unnamed protein product [Oikopleura dioica]
MDRVLTSLTRPDFRSKDRNLSLKIVLGVSGTLCVLAVIIVPSVLIPMNNSERTQSEFDQCLQSGKDNLNWCIDSCYDDISCFPYCYENFQQRMEFTCLWYTRNMYFFLYGIYGYYSVVNLDGSYNDQGIHIETPHDDFNGNAVVVNGILYVIGNDWYSNSVYRILIMIVVIVKIYKLEKCSFIKTEIEMNYSYYVGSAMLSIRNGTSALICFDNNEESRNCEIFDGNKVTKTESTIHTHGSGSLGYYKEKPTAFGTRWTECCTGAKKIEMFNNTSVWVELPDHPLDMAYVTLVGLENGALLSMGGKFNTNDQYPWKTQDSYDIWILENDIWSILGQLKESLNDRAISMVVNSSVFVFAQEMLRIDIDGNEILKQEELGYVQWPAAYLEVERGFCFDPGHNTY